MRRKPKYVAVNHANLNQAWSWMKSKPPVKGSDHSLPREVDTIWGFSAVPLLKKVHPISKLMVICPSKAMVFHQHGLVFSQTNGDLFPNQWWFVSKPASNFELGWTKGLPVGDDRDSQHQRPGVQAEFHKCVGWACQDQKDWRVCTGTGEQSFGGPFCWLREGRLWAWHPSSCEGPGNHRQTVWDLREKQTGWASQEDYAHEGTKHNGSEHCGVVHGKERCP